jgi:hypothetical protein
MQSKNDILFVTAYKNIEYNLIVYIEEDTKEKLSQYQFKPNIVFKSISEVNTFFDKYLDDDKQVMSSDIYKNKIPIRRKYNPEHVFSEYNLINHSKINFVADAKKLFPKYKFYSWIDFVLFLKI